jgi:hypothetical protein
MLDTGGEYIVFLYLVCVKEKHIIQAPTLYKAFTGYDNNIISTLSNASNCLYIERIYHMGIYILIALFIAPRAK